MGKMFFAEDPELGLCKVKSLDGMNWEQPSMQEKKRNPEMQSTGTDASRQQRLLLVGTNDLIPPGLRLVLVKWV